jgi:hypothetical protein
MIDKIYVIDDVISPGYQDFIERELLANNGQWFYQRDIAYPADGKLQKNLLAQHKTPGLSHYFFDKDYGGIKSPFHYMAYPIACEATARLNIEIKGILMGRSFMHFPLADSIRKEFDNAHTDAFVKHLVCLYYVNDTDGDTFIFDKTHYDYPPRTTDLSTVEWTVKQRVSPKKGRCVIFDGAQYHSSSTPTKDVRCIINYDLII